jgi:hypothetical protein
VPPIVTPSGRGHSLSRASSQRRYLVEHDVERGNVHRIRQTSRENPR